MSLEKMYNHVDQSHFKFMITHLEHQQIFLAIPSPRWLFCTLPPLFKSLLPHPHSPQLLDFYAFENPRTQFLDLYTFLLTVTP